MTAENDDSFIWQDYLEATNTKEVPHVLFTHVERSLAPGLRPGTVVEVPARDGDGYWPCVLTMACGPLLRVQPLGLGAVSTAPQFWCDPAKVRVHAPGWGSACGLQPIPPPELLAIAGDDIDTSSLVQAAVREARSAAEVAPPVTEDLLAGDGFIPVDRIKQGMKVEVQDKTNPYHVWVATIVENVGGRLLLRYDTPDSTYPDFWLFYSSPRLFRMGFAEEMGEPWKLCWPQDLQMKHSDKEWQAVLEMSKLEAQRMPLPSDLLQSRLTVSPHAFQKGMKLEAMDPASASCELRPATIVHVFDDHFFIVQIDTWEGACCDNNTILCTADYPYIFPVGWCEEHNVALFPPRGWCGNRFSWALYLLNPNDGPPAPSQLFKTRPSAAALGFECGSVLEAVDPVRPDLICAASVTGTIGHLLRLRLESYSSGRQHIVSADSMDIFPVGWCESNSYPLKTPISFKQSPPPKPALKMEESKKTETTNGGTGNGSSWCPEIYFNHKCFSGPFLSKGKLSGLPKSVGPGPVTLVMREVLSMVISVAYKSSRVLKELQCETKHPPPGHVLEVLKAKYKNNTYRANVAVVTSADNVGNFCKEICELLQVCPYMFGPVAVAETGCPENCSTLSKTKFTQYFPHGKRKIGRPKGEASIVVPRPRKRRGRAVGRPRQLTTGGLKISGSDKPKLGRPGPGRPRTRPRTPSPVTAQDSDSPVEAEMVQSEPSPPSSPSSPHAVQTVPVSTPSSPQHRIKEEVLPEPLPYQLDSNPLHWTEDDVYNYLVSTSDCAAFAPKFKEELIDGQAFMLLNLPTLVKQLSVQTEPALALCRHIERVKLGFLLHYCKVRDV